MDGVTFTCSACGDGRCTLTVEATYIKRFDSSRKDCDRPICPFIGRGAFMSEAEIEERGE